MAAQKGGRLKYLIFAITLAVAWGGVLPAPVFIAAAGVIVASAYWRSRQATLLRLGATFTGCTLMHVMLSRLDSEVLAAASDMERSVMVFGASDQVMATAAVVVMFLASTVALGEPRHHA